jgi:hypothetical protein
MVTAILMLQPLKATAQPLDEINDKKKWHL